jgi:hypothetical protein
MAKAFDGSLVIVMVFEMKNSREKELFIARHKTKKAQTSLKAKQ